MSELKPCPFCGSENVVRLPYNDRADIERCKNCNLTIIVPLGFTMWNTRPIEDELRARIAELEAENKWLKAKYERLKAIAERVGLIIDNANDEFLRELQSIKLQQKRGPDLDEWGNRRHSNE